MAEKKKTRKKAATKKRKPAAKKETKKEKVLKAAEVKPVEVKEEVRAPKVEKAPPPPPVKAFVPERPKKEKAPKGLKYSGTGRRKEAVAKVWLVPGKGSIRVNGKDYSEYFCGRKLLEYKVTRPLVVSNTRESYDVFVEAFGGGIPGQAGAVSLGIARALLEVSPDFRIKLKREGLLRRDPRMKERKKYGLKRARRAFQYTKR
jgi:small subunit ribosomal protein S9